MNLFKNIKGDKTIWLIVFFLSIFSVLVVYSSSIALAYRYKDGHSEVFLFKHFFISVIGLIFIYYIHKLNIKPTHLNVLGIVGTLISFFLLIWTLFTGVRAGEAARWLEIPGLGITFQSSDVAKISLIVLIARNLSIYKNKLNTLKDIFLKILLPTILICTPILISNFSTSFILALTVFYLMFLSEIPAKRLFQIIGIVFIIAVLFVTLIYFFPNALPRGKTWKSRIENFSQGDSKTNYQVEQAKIAIANGSFIGRGPGNSAQRAFLPQASSDFIYAILIEEYGTFWGFIVLLFFLIIFFRCIRIAQKSKNTFYSYIVMGLSFNLIVQAIINMAVAVNLIPVTGQPLPFISMGGTSLIFSSINIGIILNISRQVNEQSIKKEETITEQKLETKLTT
ncbi:MAG TPA: FtsW/RodA/SpoVE family cell cycle protein [Bacteroidia bacterium]|nr:FtsW/RodA/SpoVE family cell cycle protein [Bacteroidia bacterium]